MEAFPDRSHHLHPADLGWNRRYRRANTWDHGERMYTEGNPGPIPPSSNSSPPTQVSDGIRGHCTSVHTVQQGSTFCQSAMPNSCLSRAWHMNMNNMTWVSPWFPSIYPALCRRLSWNRRKNRMVESNTKCRYLTKLTCKGTLRQVF